MALLRIYGSMLRVLCRCIVDTVLTKRMQRGVSWGGIDVEFLVFSDGLLQRACFAKLWLRMFKCTDCQTENFVISSVCRLYPRWMNSASATNLYYYSLYIGNLREWFSNKRAWPGGSDARNGLECVMRVAVLNEEDGSGIVGVSLYWMVLWESSRVVSHVTWVIARVIVEAVLNTCRRRKLRTFRSAHVNTVDPFKSYVKFRI